ncbi:hypothetical protein, partial [Escherichia coli]|uniref:hypothetical protein n=1 Tax=Escherichia coli TaxID=562 RepID=UPI002245E564
FGGKTSIFSHPVYLFLRKFSLQDSRGGSDRLHGVAALIGYIHHWLHDIHKEDGHPVVSTL